MPTLKSRLSVLTVSAQASDVARRRQQDVMEVIHSEAQVMDKIIFVTSKLNLVMGLGQGVAQVRRILVS